MTLDQWLARIERLHPSEIELGLERIRAVACRLPLNSKARVISVAGTNGKGSCTALLEALASARGMSTGVYTSPHLHRFNERIRIAGEPVSDHCLVDAFEAVESARSAAGVTLTYFEFTTLAALWVFASEDLDLLVLEVGLGGRLDAVNLVDADVALVTSIGLDHTDWLGDTREAICAEKMGIGRAGRPLVFADPQPPANLDALARGSGVRLLQAGEHFGADGNELYWQYGGASRRCPSPGDVPLGSDNLVAAVQALACLGQCPAAADIASQGRACRLPGRNQKVSVDGVPWLFDVGHNREALWRFRQQLGSVPGETLALCGMLADKPAAAALSGFTDCVHGWHLCTLAGARGQSAAQLRQALPAVAEVACYDRVSDAVAAVRGARPARVLVFGSFLLLDAVARALSLDLVAGTRLAADDSGGN